VSNYGINLTNSTDNRASRPEEGPVRVALKMAVNGMLSVLNVSPVMGDARERRIADLRYSSKKVSCNRIEACDALEIIQKTWKIRVLFVRTI
jgi:hypothetical protein